MKRTLKNILMILLILVLAFLTYFTLGYMKGDLSFTNVLAEFNTKSVFFNEENNDVNEASVSSETVTISGTSSEEVTATGEEEAPGSETVIYTNDEPEYYVTGEEEQILDSIDEEANDVSLEKSLALDADFKLSDISTIYYIAFGLEGLTMSLTIAYLAYSKFNKYNFKETFNTAKRTFFYIAYSILWLLSYALVLYKYFL